MKAIRTIARSAFFGMVSALVLAAIGIGGMYWLSNGVVGPEQASDPSAEPSGERAEPPPSSAEWLIAAHDCWTGTAPADVDLPGGVVVRVDGGDAEYSENAMVIGAALDAALDGADNGVTAVAFCRGGQ